MSSVVLLGDTSGTVTLTVPAVAGTNTVTVPAGTGTMAVQGVSTNIVSSTAVASTSGTAIDFTSIPSWVKRITVMFNGVSTSGSSNVQIQIGSGSFTTTGYSGSCTVPVSTPVTTTYSSGFVVHANLNASTLAYGNAVLVNITGNTWSQTGTTASASNAITAGAGGLTLSGTLDRVRITTVNGTDTFDAGSINILYE